MSPPKEMKMLIPRMEFMIPRPLNLFAPPEHDVVMVRDSLSPGDPTPETYQEHVEVYYHGGEGPFEVARVDDTYHIFGKITGETGSNFFL